MSPKPLPCCALVVLSALVAGCGSKPPPAPPPPAAVVAEPEPPPPPPKKCEAIAEQCAASEGTRAKIAASEFALTPPPTWIYAQQGSATVAQASDSGAAIAFVGITGDAKNAKKDSEAREVAFADLSRQIGLAPPTPGTRKVPWRVPDETKVVGPLKFGQWEIKSGTRASTKGSLLVVASSTDEGKAIVGVCFAPKEGEGMAVEAILKAIESIEKVK